MVTIRHELVSDTAAREALLTRAAAMAALGVCSSECGASFGVPDF